VSKQHVQSITATGEEQYQEHSRLPGHHNFFAELAPSPIIHTYRQENPTGTHGNSTNEEERREKRERERERKK
jgi:hypothetical protein